ncbi:hypothetical protein E0687_07145 [Thermus tengchongensis]|uniref:Uncharacterized protein n=1 Tax=Thermus tengchongensis TaxID=1214928 RepID=A0A4Y9FC42_9DEIN|nr:hypothetical protein E0687_07145 [Thermus tengchongensis]
MGSPRLNIVLTHLLTGRAGAPGGPAWPPPPPGAGPGPSRRGGGPTGVWAGGCPCPSCAPPSGPGGAP